MSQNRASDGEVVEALGASLAEAIVCVRQTHSDERLLELCARWERQLAGLVAGPGRPASPTDDSYPAR